MDEGKRIIIHTLMLSEFARLSDLLYSVSKKLEAYKHLKLESISKALEEVVVHFPVYRTYITERTEQVSEIDVDTSTKLLEVQEIPLLTERPLSYW